MKTQNLQSLLKKAPVSKAYFLFGLLVLSSFTWKKDIALSNQIERLKKDLQKEQTTLDSANTKISNIKDKIYRLEIKNIQVLVDQYEKHLNTILLNPDKYSELIKEELSTIFLKERKSLTEMISQKDDDEAKELLNRILRLITKLSRCKKQSS